MIDGIGRRDFIKAASVPVLLGGASVSVPEASAVGTGEWDSYGNDIQNTGHTEEVGPTESTSVDWRFDEPEGSVDMPAVVGDGNVYVGSKDGNVYAIHEDGGTERWVLEALGDIRSAPAYRDGYVYVNVGGTTYKIETSEGEREWRHTQGIGPASSPNYEEVTDAVYLTKSGTVYALDAGDGTVIWSFDGIDRDSVSAPALDTENDMLYVGSTDGGIYGLDLIDGTQQWSVMKENGVSGGMTYKDGTVYATDERGNLYAFDGEDGNQTWSRSLGGGFNTYEEISPSVAHGRVYVGFGNMYAVDAENGNTNWSINASSSGGINGSPAVAGDAVYFADGTRLRAVSAQDGEELWDYEITRNLHSPIVSGDTVYVGSEADDNSLRSISGDAVRIGASIEITDVVLNDDRIGRNGDYSVTVSLRNEGGSSGEIELGLTRDGSLDTPRETYSVSAQDSRDVTITSQTATLEEGEYGIEVNGVSAGTLTVGLEEQEQEEGDENVEEQDNNGSEETGTEDSSDETDSETETEGDNGEENGGDEQDQNQQETDSNNDGGSQNNGTEDQQQAGGGGSGIGIPAGLVAGAAGIVGIAGGVAAAYIYSEREGEKGTEE